MRSLPRPLVLLAAGMLLLVVSSFLFRYFQYHAEDGPKAKAGVLDLTEWNFADDGPVFLNGEWEFYWNRLIIPDGSEPPPGYYPVPNRWAGSVDGERVGPYGAATYRLKVLIRPDTVHSLALRATYIRMSSAIYVNGKKIGGSGRTAAHPDDYRPYNAPYTLFFGVDRTAEQFDIVVHVANYDFFQGGISKGIHLGLPGQIVQQERMQYSLELGGIILLLSLGLYHLMAYTGPIRRQGMYFGIFCLALGFTLALHGNKSFMQWFPELPFETVFKLQFIAVFTFPICLTLFIREISSGLLSVKAAKWLQFIYFAALLPILVLPFKVYSFMGLLVYVFGLPMFISFIRILALMYVRKQYGDLGKRGLISLLCACLLLIIGSTDSQWFMFGDGPDALVTVLSSVAIALLISQMLASRFRSAFGTIERMSVELLAADKVKDEFLVNTSHEFQTPLNGIINMTQHLLEGGPGEVTERQAHHLSAIYSSARKLSSLTKDLLDMEQLKENKIRLYPETLNVQAATAVVLDVFGFLIAGKDVRIDCRIPGNLFVAADETRFSQIVYNLMGNAAKFTEKGHISITAELKGPIVALRFEDTGIGIPQDVRERIFAHYGRGGKHISDEYGGMGIGLSISRKLAESMGGRLELEWSEPNRGSRFALMLPAADPPPAVASEREAAVTAAADDGPAAAGADAKALQRPSASPQADSFGEDAAALLIVDDQPMNVQALTSILTTDGYRTISAGNGVAALEKIRTDRSIRLVLLDVVMPRMSGYEVCRRLRQTYSLFELPVIMLTVRSGPDDVAAGFAAGANDYIPKPFQAVEVRARVRTLLQMQQSVRKAIAAEMSFLQSQIKPHFLYNALNTVLHFIYENDPRAADIVNHLSQYCRNCFDIPGTEVYVSLAKELELSKAYAEIEKARFGERLDVSFDVDSRLLGMRVLPLTIQPLVENGSATVSRNGGRAAACISWCGASPLPRSACASKCGTTASACPTMCCTGCGKRRKGPRTPEGSVCGISAVASNASTARTYI